MVEEFSHPREVVKHAPLASTIFHEKLFHFHLSMETLVWQHRREMEKVTCNSLSFLSYLKANAGSTLLPSLRRLNFKDQWKIG